MKKCPLIVTAIIINSGGFDTDGRMGKEPDKADCLQKDCVWYHEYDNVCTIRTIARDLGFIARKTCDGE